MYLLDTNICIFLIKNKYPSLRKRMLQCNPSDLFLSSISIAELEYGVAKSAYRERNRQALIDFCADFHTIIPFTDSDAEAYGIIRTFLEKKGQVIGPYDMQIAAQALTRKLVIITDNYKEFIRVPGIAVENWVSGKV